MIVSIENLQAKIEVTKQIQELLERVVAVSLKNEKFLIPSEVSFMLVDDERIQEINQEQRNIDKPTDVLSFPVVEMINGKIISTCGDYDMDENLLVLGDIVLSMERAKQQSEEYGHSFEREFAFLASHGIFHLLGYDHENEDDEKEMMEKQEAVLFEIGLGR